MNEAAAHDSYGVCELLRAYEKLALCLCFCWGFGLNSFAVDRTQRQDNVQRSHV